MKAYRDNNSFGKHKPLLQQQQVAQDRIRPHAMCKKGFLYELSRIAIRFSFIIFCCLTILLVGLIVFGFAFSVNRQPNFLSINAASHAGTIAGPATGGTSCADDEAWRLILVNKWNPIPDYYEVELTVLANGESVDNRIYPALLEMFEAARYDGVYPVVVSGYRTAQEQQRLMEEKISTYKTQGYSAAKATSLAEMWVAVPGTSEHQLGIAVDIGADNMHCTNEEVYQWFSHNSYRFGFIRRYAADKTELTGIANEPWHYRYVGVDAATAIYHQGICLEEYLNQ